MVETTYGYITRVMRNKAGVPKDHNTDARTISGDAKAKSSDVIWRITKYRCHRRNLHREVPEKGGIRQSKKATRRVHGFGLHDKVMVVETGKVGYISSLKSSGIFVIKDSNGNRIEERKYERFKLLERAGGIRLVPSASSI